MDTWIQVTDSYLTELYTTIENLKRQLAEARELLESLGILTAV